MKQISCKRLSVFLITFCLFVTARAQDSSRVLQSAAPTKESTKALKPTVKPAAKTVQTPAKVAPKSLQQISPPTSPPPPAQSPARIDHSLKGQYEDLLKYSWMQKGFKVIQPARLTALWKSVNDSLNTHKSQLEEARLKLVEQTKLISDLKNASSSSTGKETTITPGSSVSQINILGMPVDIATYNWIVWGTILLLGLGLAGVLFTTTKNSFDAKEHRQRYEEISLEYQTYKTKSKEKELKLARELQTERNTIEELLEKKNEGEPAKKAKK